MLVEDSSSVNVSSLIVTQVEQVFPGCKKISTVEGPVFYVRLQYLYYVNSDSIVSGKKFSEEESEDIINAGIIYGIERKALDFLSRAEQSRFLLTKKLIGKGFKIQYIKPALDFLEEKNYLSDSRFAEAWLNYRLLSKYEGRIKLELELQKRGITKICAKKALDAFFKLYTEDDLCKKAIEKCKRQGKTSDKTVTYLLHLGFNYRVLDKILKKNNFESY